MAEATKPKYDSLPGIDNAPDVYETPELDNDASTVQASTAVSEADSGSDNDEESAVRRARLQPDQARNRFRPSRVDAQGVDFSDNIAAQRRSYRTSTVGQRRRGEIIGDDSGDEKESFAKKLLRIKQETAELEREYQERLATGDKSKIEEKDPKEIMEYISDKVDMIYAMRRGGARGAEAQLERSMNKFNNYPKFGPSVRISQAIEKQPPLPGSQIQKSQLDYVLNQAREFDARMTVLEKSLGLDGNTMPDVAEKPPFPVFTMLQLMDLKMSTVADASSGSLDNATQQVKKLIAEAEHLKELRQEAAQTATGSDSKAIITPDQESKINALYGTLPAIEKLTPTLPMTLEHLRTLRYIHTSASEAEAVLTELEKRQSKQEDEISKWQRSLEVVESDVKICEKNMQNNMKIMGTQVRELEERVARLPGAAPTQQMADLSLADVKRRAEKVEHELQQIMTRSRDRRAKLEEMDPSTHDERMRSAAFERRKLEIANKRRQLEILREEKLQREKTRLKETPAPTPLQLEIIRKRKLLEALRAESAARRERTRIELLARHESLCTELLARQERLRAKLLALPESIRTELLTLQLVSMAAEE